MSSREVYRSIASIEPLLPDFQSPKLADLSQQATLAIGELNAHLPSPVVRKRVSQLVRKMNCYYSNLIEGHKTLPKGIERASQQQLTDGSLEEQKKILLAEAHIQTEEAMTDRLNTEAGLDVYSSEFIAWIHKDFFERLPESLRQARTVSGETYGIIPGKMRDFMVDVRQHTPPDYEALPAFMERFQAVYGSSSLLATNQLPLFQQHIIASPGYIRSETEMVE